MKTIFFVAIIVLCISCERDFLKEDPKGVLSPNVLFQTKGGILIAASGLSALLSDAYNTSGYVVAFMGGDDLTGHPYSGIFSFRQLDIFSPDKYNGRIIDIWHLYYRTIHEANLILEFSELSPDDECTVNDCLGLAHFYRAFCYAQLTRIWGKVPLIAEYVADRDYSKCPVAEVADIYELILTDLQHAEELLPDTRTDGSFPGAKPVSGAAKTLLSQVYLTMAGWPLKQTSCYALAADKAKEVIDEVSSENLYGYELLDDPNDLWTWANNYTNKEIIFGMYYNFEAGPLNLHSPISTRAEDEELFNGALGWSDYFAELSFFKRFPSGPRKDATFATVINSHSYGPISWDDPRTLREHPYYKKYWEDHPQATWMGARTEPLIRYADVLLIYAEARAMSAGADEPAYDALNQVRNRAGLPDLTTGLAAAAFRDSVFAERGWEFAGGEPSSRWFDLIRLEKLEEFTLLRDSNEIPMLHFPTHDDYWLPLPYEVNTGN